MVEQAYGERTSRDVPERIDFLLIRLALVLSFGAILALLDMTIVNVAIEPLAVEFGVSLATIQWVSTAYLIAVAVAIPVAGWAVDRFGGRRVWLAAISLFMAGSLLAGMSWDAPTLIGSRVVQGLGGGMLEPVALAMVASAAGPKRLNRTMALMLVPLNLGPIIGPVLGGVILDSTDWRWIFLVNIPIGALALALGYRYVPRDTPELAAREPFDLRGALLLLPGFAVSIYALTAAAESMTSAPFLVSAAFGVSLLALYGLHAMRSRTMPLLDLRLFTNRRFAMASAIAGLVASAGFSTNFLVPLYVQQVYAERALAAGVSIVPLGLGIGLGMLVVTAWGDRPSVRPLVLPGAALMIAASLGLTMVGAGIGARGMLLLVLTRGIGIALVMGPTMAGIYRVVPEQQAARATSMLYIVLQLSASIAIAVVAFFLQLRLGAGDPSQWDVDAFGRAFRAIAWGYAVVGVGVLGMLLAATRAVRKPTPVADAPAWCPVREATCPGS